jgi:hypothetical protein
MMSKLTLIKQTISNKTAMKRLMVKKYSPEILMGLGIVGVVTSTVMACKATLKVEDILDEAKATMEDVDHVLENPELFEGSYTPEDAKKDKSIVYVQTGVKLVKLYAPSIALGVISISALLGSHKIMKQRNVAVVAAYNGLKMTFDNYRRRVIEEFGEDKDRDYRYGLRKEEVEVIETDKNGKEKKTKKIATVVDPNHISPYARFFDETSTEWSKTPEYNRIFLQAQQNYANNLLQARGHLFLNEVYDMLGWADNRTQAGAVVGWVLSDDDDADNYVDFGIFNPENSDFVNGLEGSVLLDFNVQGVIYDKI